VVNIYVVFGGFMGAIAWNLLTWWWALPRSSSHAIISGYAGAAIAKAGMGAILVAGWIPVLAFLVISPLIGFALGWAIMTFASRLTYRVERHRAQGVFRHLQLVSAGAYSLGHGTNDAQKTMGIITALLVAGGHKEWTTGNFQLIPGQHHQIALWIILACHAAMALGTMAGGWRIVKTMGSRITPHLRPVGGMRGGDQYSCGYVCQYPHFDHPRHRRQCGWGRCHPRRSRCPLAVGAEDCLGVGADIPRSWFDRCPILRFGTCNS